MPIDPTKLKVGTLLKAKVTTDFIYQGCIYKVVKVTPTNIRDSINQNYLIDIEDMNGKDCSGYFPYRFELVEQESNTMKEIYIDDIPTCHELEDDVEMQLFLPIDTSETNKKLFFERTKNIGYRKGINGTTSSEFFSIYRNKEFFIISGDMYLHWSNTVNPDLELYKVIFIKQDNNKEEKQQLSKLSRQFIKLFEEEE